MGELRHKLITVCCGLLLVLALLVSRSQEIVHPHHITRIASMDPEWSRPFWVTDHELIVWRPDSQNPHLHQPIFINTTSGQRTTVPSQDFEWTPRTPILISPDGQWRLNVIRENEEHWFVSAMHGTQQYRGLKFDSYDYMSVTWLPDSKHWAILQGRDRPIRLDIFEVSGKEPIQSIPITGLDGSPWDMHPGQNDHLLFEMGTQHHFLEYAEMDLKAIGTPLQRSHLDDLSSIIDDAFGPKQNAAIHLYSHLESACSHSATRIAWGIFTHEKPLGDILEVPFKYKRSNVDTDYQWLTIYVSDRSGKKLQRVGVLPWDDDPQEVPSCLSWRPGDKELSFVRQREMYTISVDSKLY